jgi:hypothetical protein
MKVEKFEHCLRSHDIKLFEPGWCFFQEFLFVIKVVIIHRKMQKKKRKKVGYHP